MMKIFNYVNNRTISINNKYKLFFISNGISYGLLGLIMGIISYDLFNLKKIYIWVFTGYFIIYSFIKGYIFLVKHQFNS